MINIATLTMPYRCRLIIQAYRDWIKNDEKILDIGCGNGIVANFLIKHLEVNITGCDIENYLIYDLPFVKIAKDKFPFSNRRYDVALLNDVLHHIDLKDQKTVKTFLVSFLPYCILPRKEMKRCLIS